MCMEAPGDFDRKLDAELVEMKECKKTWTVVVPECAQMFQRSQEKGRKDINIETNEQAV